MDVTHCMIRHKGRYKIRMVYTVPALNRDGKKEAPGLYLRESEDVRCRLSALVYLQNPGLQAIRLAAADLF